MSATSIFLLLAICLAGQCTGATRSNFPFDKVSDIAQALPKHSVTFVERKLFVKPNEEIVDVPSKISAMPPMEITTDKNMPSSTTETNIGMTTDENVDTFTDSDVEVSEEEKAAKMFAMEFNQLVEEDHRRVIRATWNHQTNLTAENAAILYTLRAEIVENAKKRMPEIYAFNYTTYTDPMLRRQFEFFRERSDDVLSAEKYEKMINAVGAMTTNYAKIRICSYKDTTKCDLQLEPELTMIMKTSEDPEELKYYWQQWYDKAGTPMRKNFEEYVELRNEAARLNDRKSGAEMWIKNYEDKTFEKQLEDIFFFVRPLFEELHAYVRHALSEKFGEDLVDGEEPIPMHLLGNMWAQDWSDVDKYVTPFPRLKLPDFTEEMHKQNYTVLDIYKLAENFFTSMGLAEMTKEFWERSILEKPKGREIICHATAWDMVDGPDYRIKQCTRITMQDVYVAHHEMGHVEYFMLYRPQPMVFRGGANQGFHEALGDMIALSVMTPKYWQLMGLMQDIRFTKGGRINQLFRMALAKLPILQFIYALDTYRYAVFRGHVKPEKLNCEYWDTMEKVLGVKPPVQRYAEDFDPPAKYHVSADIEYMRYMVATIIQFQMHKALCEVAGEYDPDKSDKQLSDCCLYGNKKVGNMLKKVLSKGTSVPWPDQLEMLTGSRKLDAQAMIEYFEPLYRYLVKSNRKNGLQVGWTQHHECLDRNQTDESEEMNRENGEWSFAEW